MGWSTFVLEYGRLGALCGDTSSAAVTRQKEMINEAIMSTVAAHDWAWLKNPYTDAFNTEAPYSTGTVSTTKGSTTLTGSGALWTTAGYSTSAGLYEVLIGGEVYGVTLSADNAGTMTRAAVATLSGVTFTVLRRVYALSARMRSLDAAWVMANPQYPLLVMAGLPLARRLSLTPAPSFPEVIGFVNIDSSDVSQVILDPPPSAAQSVYYSGMQEVAALTSDASVIPTPPRFQTAIHKFAEYLLWTSRSDPRAAGCLRAYELFIADLITRDDPSQGELDQGNLSPHVFRSARDIGTVPARSGRL